MLMFPKFSSSALDPRVARGIADDFSLDLEYLSDFTYMIYSPPNKVPGLFSCQALQGTTLP